MTISQSKLNWEKFYISMDDFMADYPYSDQHLYPMTPQQQVLYYAKAIQFAFQSASKELPQEARPDAICWCMTSQELLKGQNEAMAMESMTKNDADWEQFKEVANEFMLMTTY